MTCKFTNSFLAILLSFVFFAIIRCSQDYCFNCSNYSECSQTSQYEISQNNQKLLGFFNLEFPDKGALNVKEVLQTFRRFCKHLFPRTYRMFHLLVCSSSEDLPIAQKFLDLLVSLYYRYLLVLWSVRATIKELLELLEVPQIFLCYCLNF